MRKRLLSVLMALCMVLSLAPTMAFAWTKPDNISVENVEYYDSGALKKVESQFKWYTASAPGQAVLMTEKLRSKGENGTNATWGDFTDLGYYGTEFANIEAVKNYDAEHHTFGIVSCSDSKEIQMDQMNTLEFEFDETDIPLDMNEVYYVYLWTQYSGNCYPDVLLYVIGVEDGAVKYTPATDRNEYNSDGFVKVESQTPCNVTITAGANMTKTDASGAASQTGLKTGMTPVVYTANEGYYFPETYVVPPVSGIMVRRDSDHQITVLGTPTASATITLAAAVEKTYSITTSNDGNGTASATPESAKTGTEITLTATPDEGYRFKEWQVVSGGVTITDNIFTMGTADVKVKAIFEEIPAPATKDVEEVTFLYAYDVQRNPAFPTTSNKTLTLSGHKYPLKSTGDSYNTNEGTWTLSKVGTYAFVISNDATKDKVGAYLSSVAEKVADASGLSKDNVVIHELKNVDDHVAYGVVIAYDKVNEYAVFIGDNHRTGAGYFLSTRDDKPSSIEATDIATDFADKVVNYTVTVQAENGTATASPATAEAGTTVTLTATPNEGYVFDKWEVVSGGVTITDNKFTMGTENVTVKACFKAIPSTPSRPSSSKPTYPAKVEEKADLENGAISFSKDRVRAGRTVTITVTPDAGYVLDKLVILDDDGKAVSFKDNGNGTYTFTMPVGGVEVEPFFVAAAPAKEPVTLVLFVDQVAYLLDGEPLVNDVAPVIKAERTTLPIRLVAETLGAKVDWSEADQTVTITKDDMTIVIYIGQGFALVNGDPVELDCPAYIANSRTYLPVRFVSENLGAEVTWGGADGSVTIVVE